MPKPRTQRTPLNPPRRAPAAWCVAGIVLLATLFYVVAFVALVLPSNGWRMGLISGAAALPIGLPIAIAWARRRSRLDWARLRWHRVCPACRTDLRTAEDPGTCPGCGRAYAFDALIREWEGMDEKPARAKRWKSLSARPWLPQQFMIGLAPLAVGLIAAHLLVKLGFLAQAQGAIALAFFGPASAAIGVAVARRNRQDHALLERDSYRTCPECLAPLPTLNSEESAACCFTCGQAFTASWLRDTWRLIYAPYTSAMAGGTPWRPSRSMRRMSILFGAVVLGGVILLRILDKHLGIRSLPLPVMLGVVGLMGLAALVFLGYLASHGGYHHARMLKLRAAGYRCCPECGYDLRESAPDGSCPECGEDYTPDSLRSRWEGDAKVDPPGW